MNDLERCIDNENGSEETGLQPIFETAQGKLSLRGAINSHCRDCIYDPFDKGAGNWRQQTEACTVSKCGLYPVRPISKPRKTTRLLPEAPGVPTEQLPSTEE